MLNSSYYESTFSVRLNLLDECHLIRNERVAGSNPASGSITPEKWR